MSHERRITAMFSLILLGLFGALGWADTTVPLLDVPVVNGSIQRASATKIKSESFSDGFSIIGAGLEMPSVTFKLDGNYKSVRFKVGVDNSSPENCWFGLTVKLDNREALKYLSVKPLEPASVQEFSTRDVIKLNLTYACADINWEKYLRVVEAVAVKADQEEKPVSGSGGGTAYGAVKPGGTAPAADKPHASQRAEFVVDPRDIKQLASDLRKAVDSDPDVAKAVDSGKVGIIRFESIDISSPSVAINVVEDLSTALIKNKFKLVERAQFNKILEELKIEDTALIDRTKAQELGKQSGCAYVVLGSISSRGNSVVINARLMRTETGLSVEAADVTSAKIPIAN